MLLNFISKETFEEGLEVNKACTYIHMYSVHACIEKCMQLPNLIISSLSHEQVHVYMYMCMYMYSLMIFLISLHLPLSDYTCRNISMLTSLAMQRPVTCGKQWMRYVHCILYMYSLHELQYMQLNKECTEMYTVIQQHV